MVKASGTDVVVVSSCRTPVGFFRITFDITSAVDLGTTAVKTAIERAGLKPIDVDEVTMGCVLTANLGHNVTRQVALNAGVPLPVPCLTVDKLCSSGLTAHILAAKDLQLGECQMAVAGGMESMSQCPFYLPREEMPYGGTKILDGVLVDGLTDVSTGLHLGELAEKTAKAFGITREMQDEYAIGSYKKATAAWKNGAFASEIIPMTVKMKRGGESLVKDDDNYKVFNETKMKTMAPAFLKENGTITAANASSINDGAAASVLTTMAKAQQLGLKPLSRIVGYATAGLEPVDFTLAPIYAMSKVLEKCDVRKEDVDLWEINEAFSVTPLVCAKQLGVPMDRLNIHGGAVALGHPLAMSGARLVTHLSHTLKPGQKGMIGICNGGGEATAMLLEGL